MNSEYFDDAAIELHELLDNENVVVVVEVVADNNFADVLETRTAFDNLNYVAYELVSSYVDLAQVVDLMKKMLLTMTKRQTMLMRKAMRKLRAAVAEEARPHFGLYHYGY